jgi:outer membrane protein assembly factor BamB
MIFSEKKPGMDALRQWTAVAAGLKKYDQQQKFPRPDYSMNDTFAQVKRAWTLASDANIISTPAVAGENVFVGNQNGKMSCFNLKNGKEQWSFATKGAIFSSPAVKGERVVFGSGDGTVYCLQAKTGKLIWKKETGTAVLGCPLIQGDTIFIGGSGHAFYALETRSGKSIWTFNQLNGPVVSTPLLYGGNLIFGAWDCNLYALNSANGQLSWKWNNGTTVINYSPASCIPVAADGNLLVYRPMVNGFTERPCRIR